MKLKRDVLVRHLSRIFCSGQIGEVVLFENFASFAITEDHQLLVVADGLEGVEPLPEPVGILNFDLFIRSLKTLGEDGKQDIDVTFEQERVVISEGSRGTIRLVTADPDTISTNVEDENVHKALQHIDKDAGYAIPQGVVESVRKTAALVKADVVKITRSKGKNTMISVGSEDADHAEFSLPKSRMRKNEGEAYELLLEADKVTAVLNQVHDFSATEIGFTGPDSLVGIWDLGMTYILSPADPAE